MKNKTLIILFTLLFTFTVSAVTEIGLNKDNTVLIRGEISESSIDQALEDLVDLDHKRINSSQIIYIVLDSPGGSITAGLKFIEFANTVPNVKTICLFCASMAHAISQGVTGQRLATEKNIMMAHRASGTFSGQFADGEVESRLKVFTAMVRSMEKQNASRIKISIKHYRSKVINEWWSFGEESVKLNIVDKLVTIKCSRELIKYKRAAVIMTLFGPMSGPQRSQCPLL